MERKHLSQRPDMHMPNCSETFATAIVEFDKRYVTRLHDIRDTIPSITKMIYCTPWYAQTMRTELIKLHAGATQLQIDNFLTYSRQVDCRAPMTAYFLGYDSIESLMTIWGIFVDISRTIFKDTKSFCERFLDSVAWYFYRHYRFLVREILRY